MHRITIYLTTFLPILVLTLLVCGGGIAESRESDKDESNWRRPEEEDFIRHIIEEGVKPALFGSSFYDPIKQVFVRKNVDEERDEAPIITPEDNKETQAPLEKSTMQGDSTRELVALVSGPTTKNWGKPTPTGTISHKDKDKSGKHKASKGETRKNIDGIGESEQANQLNNETKATNDKGNQILRSIGVTEEWWSKRKRQNNLFKEFNNLK